MSTQKERKRKRVNLAWRRFLETAWHQNCSQRTKKRRRVNRLQIESTVMQFLWFRWEKNKNDSWIVGVLLDSSLCDFIPVSVCSLFCFYDRIPVLPLSVCKNRENDKVREAWDLLRILCHSLCNENDFSQQTRREEVLLLNALSLFSLSIQSVV